LAGFPKNGRIPDLPEPKSGTPPVWSDNHVVACVEFGPDAVYSASPPRLLVSRDGSMSSRVSLVLTSANAGSVFACIASHPTFAGNVGSQTVQFMLPAGQQMARAEGTFIIAFIHMYLVNMNIIHKCSEMRKEKCVLLLSLLSSLLL